VFGGPFLEWKVDSRSSSLAFASEVVDEAQHILAAGTGVDDSATQRHADFAVVPDHQQALEEEVTHVHADKDATVTRVVLLGGVGEVDEIDGLVDETRHLPGGVVGLGDVAGGHAVVVEGDAVDEGDEQQGPVGATFGDGDRVVVVDGQEDVGYVGEVGQGVLEKARVNLVPRGS
jgi:hypothetical protein